MYCVLQYCVYLKPIDNIVLWVVVGLLLCNQTQAEFCQAQNHIGLANLLIWWVAVRDNWSDGLCALLSFFLSASVTFSPEEVIVGF